MHSAVCPIPQEKVLRHAEELFEEGDENKDGRLSSAELQALLIKVLLDRAASMACMQHPFQSGMTVSIACALPCAEVM